MNYSKVLPVLLVAMSVVIIGCKKKQPHPLDKTNAVIIGDNVNIRQNPSVSAPVVVTENTGALVHVKATSEKRDKLDAKREFSYFWYNVELSSGKTGWVFGQFLYTFDESFKSTVTFDGDDYILAMFNEEEYSQDMPSDDSYAVPFMYQPLEGRLYPLYCTIPVDSYLKHRSGSSYTKSYFALIGNTGFDERIDPVMKVEGDQIMITVNVSLQAGGGKYTLVIEKIKDRFLLTAINNYNVRVLY